MVPRSQYLPYLTSILIFLSYTSCEDVLPHASSFISFNDVFAVVDSDMNSESKQKCGNFAELLSDDSKLELFNGEILGLLPGSREEMLVRKSSLALRCYQGSGGIDALPNSLGSETPASCMNGCIERSYIVLDANRSRAFLINVFIESSQNAGARNQGQNRQPLAASIVVRTMSDSRYEAISRALQQLRRNGSISDNLIDRSSTVVRKLDTRRFRVILKYDRFF